MNRKPASRYQGKGTYRSNTGGVGSMFPLRWTARAWNRAGHVKSPSSPRSTGSRPAPAASVARPVAQTPVKTPLVGRTPWSAADAPVGLSAPRRTLMEWATAGPGEPARTWGSAPPGQCRRRFSYRSLPAAAGQEHSCLAASRLIGTLFGVRASLSPGRLNVQVEDALCASILFQYGLQLRGQSLALLCRRDLLEGVQSLLAHHLNAFRKVQLVGTEQLGSFLQ